jgi:hypothetical protein
MAWVRKTKDSTRKKGRRMLGVHLIVVGEGGGRKARATGAAKPYTKKKIPVRVLHGDQSCIGRGLHVGIRSQTNEDLDYLLSEAPLWDGRSS